MSFSSGRLALGFFLGLAGAMAFGLHGCGGGSSPPLPNVPIPSIPPSVAATPSDARAADGSFISWREHRIDDEGISGSPIRGGDGLQLGDLDGDGIEDIVSVHEDSHHVRLAFGTGDPERWQLATVAEGSEAKSAEDVAIGDVNRDGDLDLLVACELDHLLYLENPLIESGPEAVRSGAWPREIIAGTAGRGSWIRVFLADLDDDGDLEATAANKGDLLYAGLSAGDPESRKAISYFDIEGDPLDSGNWREYILKKIPVPINARPIDLDGDGDLDIVGGSRIEARIFWFENRLDSPGGKLSFREHAIEVSNRSVAQRSGPKRLTGMNMDFADLDLDGDLDIVLQETPFRNIWLEQPTAPSDPWPIHPIGNLFPDSPTALTLADIDEDGDLDLMTGGYSEEPRDRDGEHITAASRTGRIAFYENRMRDSAAGGDQWIRHDISRRVRGMFDIFQARDLDRDGDLDFVATRGNSGEYDGVFWLEQLRSTQPRRAFEPARENESRPLPLPPPR